MAASELGVALRGVIEVMDFLGIRYAVGGSVASSVHGVPRYTVDADVTVEPFPGRESVFAGSFNPAEYYVDAGMIREAFRLESSFNIIDLRSVFKIDVFVKKSRPFDRTAFDRRVTSPLFGIADRKFDVVSAEDMILLKLEWYRLGNEISDRQWHDIQGVLKVQAERLDRDYLAHWAAELGVADLLDKAIAEAGV